ncbi:MAG TPA: hypothetical protein VGG05_17505 [Pseudonocardiaceae bacterium]
MTFAFEDGDIVYVQAEMASADIVGWIVPGVACRRWQVRERRCDCPATERQWRQRGCVSGASISCKGHGAGKVCAFISEFNASVGAFLNAGEPCETIH